MSDVTHLLGAIDRGDRRAAEELLPLVYDDLRKLAASKFAQERPGQTLQATALVHEAYLRLVGPGDPGWDSRGHLFAAAAEAMRRILVENARRRSRQKRGGGRARAEPMEAALIVDDSPDEVLAIDEALGRLALRQGRAPVLG